jgi:glutamine phosphoribosylpyrophosphate amidotransferase
MPMTMTAKHIGVREPGGNIPRWGRRSGNTAFLAGDACAPADIGAEHTRGIRPVRVEEKEPRSMAAGQSTGQTKRTHELNDFSRLYRTLFEKNVDKIRRTADAVLAGGRHRTAVPDASRTSLPGTSRGAGIPIGSGLITCPFAGTTSTQLERPDRAGSGLGQRRPAKGVLTRTRVGDSGDSVLHGPTLKKNSYPCSSEHVLTMSA